MAGGQLPVGGPDLPDGQPAAAGAAAPRAHQAPAAGSLGDDARAELRLRAPQPGHRGAGPGHDLRDGPRARRARPGGGVVAGGHLQRDLPRRVAGRGRDAAAVHPVLLPGRHPQPRGPGDARLDPRGRRAGLLPLARLRGGARQSRTSSWRRSWATARPRPGRWRRAGTPTSSLDPVTDGAVLPILHLNGYKIANPTVLARIPREELLDLLRGYGHTPYLVEGDDPQTMHQQFAATLDRCLDEIAEIQRRARVDGVRRAAALADDRARLPEGLDRAEGGRRPAGRGHLARPPGAVRERPGGRRPPEGARGVDAQLPPRGALRRRRRARCPPSAICTRRATGG